jgi:hypothetical protein
MGVLEDAIREHLELKRQHGASEQELSAQENEALGPARREVAAAEELEAAEAALDTELVAEADEPVPAAGDLSADALPPSDAPEFEPSAEVTSLAEDGPDRAVEADFEVEADDSAIEPLPAQAEPPPQAVEPELADEPESEPELADEPESEPALEDAQTATEGASDEVRFDEEEPAVAPPMPAPYGDEFDEEVPAGPSEEAPSQDDEVEDVLEETPEFLEETPEHDRLWFEQKPPRDFDFD